MSQNRESSTALRTGYGHPVLRPAAVFALLFAAVLLTHLTLLHLPYFWDEGGYYVPAALDFYRTGTLIPQFTNAHPPLPNVVLGLAWHLFGMHILVTRVLACLFAALGLTAIFTLTRRLLGTCAALIVTALTFVYPIWFAQSSLYHADIVAAAFTLWALAVYLPSFNTDNVQPTTYNLLLTAGLFTLAALSKETGILWPAALAAMHLLRWLRRRAVQDLRWLLALSSCVLPLIAWYIYHRARTGFTFGNPEYLRYNATANFNAAHVALALWYRVTHIVWQRNMWLPLLLALACLWLPKNPARTSTLTPHTQRILLWLVIANWLAFSVLGGALLTRYLLPVYPLLLLLAVDLWLSRTRGWTTIALIALTATAFISAIWMNPPTSFAPEDNLTYRDMILVHQQAIAYTSAHFPQATVLTAWPVAADLVRPELGYVAHPFKTTTIDNFTLDNVLSAAARPGDYDTAIVFVTHFYEPGYRRYLAEHPDTYAGRDFRRDRDLTPDEIAHLLHGRVVWKNDIHGEWAAVLRFDRTYDARNTSPSLPPSAR